VPVELMWLPAELLELDELVELDELLRGRLGGVCAGGGVGGGGGGMTGGGVPLLPSV
jgi:hypothetical protein